MMKEFSVNGIKFRTKHLTGTPKKELQMVLIGGMTKSIGTLSDHPTVKHGIVSKQSQIDVWNKFQKWAKSKEMDLLENS